MSQRITRLSSHRGGSVFEISGTNQAGLRVYYYLLVDKLKEALLTRPENLASLNLQQLGRVLYAGLGDPSDASRAKSLSLLQEQHA